MWEAGCSSERVSLLQSSPPMSTGITLVALAPLYYKAKVIEAATASGLLSPDELSQMLRQMESAVVRAYNLGPTPEDRRILSAYREGLRLYQLSYTLWERNSRANDPSFGGLIPLQLPHGNAESLLPLARSLDLTVTEHTNGQTGARFQAVSAHTVEEVWIRAQAVIDRANEQLCAAPRPHILPC